MAAEHEYAVIGHSRSRIGFILALIAGSIAGLAAEIARRVLVSLATAGDASTPQLILWPVTGAAVFGVVFLLFDRIAWRVYGVAPLIGVPNIGGEWSVQGKSFDTAGQPKSDWQACMIITQHYEKIHIHLKTTQSASQSITAAIIPEGNAGYRLIYSYRNDVKPGEGDMQSHIGHCSLLFCKNLDEASGDYFTSGGRQSIGTMELKKDS